MYLRAHLAHDHNGRLAQYPATHLNFTKVRRQSTVVGRLTFAAMQRLVCGGSQLAGDSFVDKLTENDSDHPQKTKEQLAEEQEDAEKDKEDAERKDW